MCQTAHLRSSAISSHNRQNLNQPTHKQAATTASSDAHRTHSSHRAIIMGARTPATTSLAVAAVLAVLAFASLQLFADTLRESKVGTIGAGFVSSLIYIMTLTAINNIECSVFGSNYQAGIFPECVLALFVAMACAATIHGVSVTTCFLFSCGHTFFLNRLSTQLYSSRKQ
ncbi:hypothetical protein PTSG_12688 [Salpingoeca rosetta]|uniref:Uncharacterized protein n=1 Tax=Salpingoeca rosetta (strain ATCC 50818 / BSB-021) TaxID=946362 RepID=F2UI52_SALR5|nr:uncharacterized protein PTSG_12688 [Salpingoeca rosetta]EGD76801.1 hypothetical protein PTSG_12688 [Salpingoeca rosetta]|eukprot:XP_004991173.1 hypothetical protein PTSG_12688 [Salpingoeca rosetta]